MIISNLPSSNPNLNMCTQCVQCLFSHTLEEVNMYSYVWAQTSAKLKGWSHTLEFKKRRWNRKRQICWYVGRSLNFWHCFGFWGVFLVAHRTILDQPHSPLQPCCFVMHLCSIRNSLPFILLTAFNTGKLKVMGICMQWGKVGGGRGGGRIEGWNKDGES